MKIFSEKWQNQVQKFKILNEKQIFSWNGSRNSCLYHQFKAASKKLAKSYG